MKKTTRQWLKDLRLQKGLTQTQVAEKGNFARTYYTMVENGVRTPSVKMAKDIGEVLEFDWTKFFE